MSTQKPKFYGTMIGGRFAFADGQKEAYTRHASRFPEGKDMEIMLERRYKRRTSGQPDEETNFNGYLWAVIIPMVAEEMGENDWDYVHNTLQMLFNKRGVRMMDPATKQVINIEVPIGTKHLSGSEFAEYCSRIRTWAAIPGNLSDGGCYIPEPREVIREW